MEPALWALVGSTDFRFGSEKVVNSRSDEELLRKGYHSHIYVLGAIEIILIQNAMLRRCAIHPSGHLTFNQNAYSK